MQRTAHIFVWRDGALYSGVGNLCVGRREELQGLRRQETVIHSKCLKGSNTWQQHLWGHISLFGKEISERLRLREIIIGGFYAMKRLCKAWTDPLSPGNQFQYNCTHKQKMEPSAANGLRELHIRQTEREGAYLLATDIFPHIWAAGL